MNQVLIGWLQSAKNATKTTAIERSEKNNYRILAQIEDQALTSPQRSGFDRQINHGIMECRRSAFGGMEKWNIEYSGSKVEQFCNTP
ncbi:MAG: hypothetical protein JSW26_06310 [Desulfobacterales bacterium]|nr:MAG: hypothetical protein JSW26_06310 [Desulfobacterales bacterium]